MVRKSVFLDTLILGFLAVWLGGGFPYHGKLLLSHGADPRRAALLLALAGGFWFARTGQGTGGSRILAAAQWVAEALERPRVRWAALCGGFVGAAGLGIAQALALRSTLYDPGIFHQILWNISQGHGFLSTISGAGNFLLDHFSPALAVLTPFFWLSGGSALTLPILHAALIFGGIAAWVWLAERLPGVEAPARARIAAATVVFGLCFDSLWGNLRWGFHENAISFAALSWGLALLFAGEVSCLKRRAVMALFLVAAASKEILLVDLALAFGVWAGLEWRERRHLTFVLGVFALILLGGFVFFEKLPHPADKNYFDRYYAYLGRDLGTLFSTAVLKPWVVIQKVGAKELLRYVTTVFLPWLIPLAAWALARKRAGARVGSPYASPWFLLLGLPSFASAALATYPPLREKYFHYVLELWPVLAGLAVVGLGAVAARRPEWLARTAWVWALLALLAMDQDPWGDLRAYVREIPRVAEARAALAALPEAESVMADELAGPWVSSRKLVTRFPSLWLSEGIYQGRCPDWIVIREHQETEIPQVLKACAPQSPSSPSLAWQHSEWKAFRIK